jgi:hypothetical protein
MYLCIPLEGKIGQGVTLALRCPAQNAAKYDIDEELAETRSMPITPSSLKSDSGMICCGPHGCRRAIYGTDLGGCQPFVFRVI